MVDAGEERARLEQARVARHPRLEVGAVVGDEQVHELVQQDVVDDVARASRQPVGEPDRAVEPACTTPSAGAGW